MSAETCERDADDLMKTAYMRRFIGEEFEAAVANITGFGMFVELENTVEGLVRTESMTYDYYEYDENIGALVGKRTGRVYKSGDRVKVILAKADVSLRRIDFVLSRDADEEALNKITRKKEAFEGKNVKSKGKKRKNNAKNRGKTVKNKGKKSKRRGKNSQNRRNNDTKQGKKQSKEAK